MSAIQETLRTRHPSRTSFCKTRDRVQTTKLSFRWVLAFLLLHLVLFELSVIRMEFNCSVLELFFRNYLFEF